jgi:hypothetical protein
LFKKFCFFLSIFWNIHPSANDDKLFNISSNLIVNHTEYKKTRPAWAGFKTVEEGRAKNVKIFVVIVELSK